MQQKYIITTHSGRFHADDACAIAILLLVHNLKADSPDIEIIRSRKSEDWERADFVVDVGGEYDSEQRHFDHHQKGGAGERENGIPYAACGLVWKHYGETACINILKNHHRGESSQTTVTTLPQRIDDEIIAAIDASDNGVSLGTQIHSSVRPVLISDIVQSFVPSWKSRTNEQLYIAFIEAVVWMQDFLLRAIKKSADILEGEDLVRKAYDQSNDKQIIVLENTYPWHRVLMEMKEPLFVVCPDSSNSGNWEVNAVKKSIGSFENRKDLPITWAGKTATELVDASGVPDALFAHNKRFIAVAGSKEGALALAQIALAS